ncbi:hypothetical protein ACVW0P_003868 [Mucilaginibacter sp. UYNi724]
MPLLCGRGIYSFYLISNNMEAAFIDHLDQIYWQGYGEDFKADNPQAFYRQLAEFKNQHHLA